MRAPGSFASSARTLRRSANERARCRSDGERASDEIAAVDLAILADVNARIELVARIRRYKADAGLPFVDRDRERELVEALDLQNAGPLSDDGLRELYATCSTSRSARSQAGEAEGRRHRRKALSAGDLASCWSVTDCVESSSHAGRG